MEKPEQPEEEEEEEEKSCGPEEIVISSLHIGNRIWPSRSSSLQVTSALHLISLYLFFFLPTCLSVSYPGLQLILGLWQNRRKKKKQRKNTIKSRES